MTILSIGGAQTSNNNNSPNIAIVGISAGAAVVGVLGIAFAIAFSRRSPKHHLTRSVLHEDIPEVKVNPIRAPQPIMERQRSMTYPIETETSSLPPPVLKNPFMARPMSMKFMPTTIRTNYDIPPPPPPMEDV
jgi:hypothetical protein